MKAALRKLSQSPVVQSVVLAFVLAALLLNAIYYFFSTSFLQTHDGLLHLYRLIALDYSIQHGDLWPRFASGLIFGYGSPVFNYYAPSSLYIPEMLHLLGVSFKSAFSSSYFIYSYIGMGGIFLLSKSLFNRLHSEGWKTHLAGLAAAVAYAYAPYTLYNLNERGAISEIFALAMLPWVLWGFRRLAASGARLDFVLAVILFTLFIPIHNITALNSIVILALFCVYLWRTATESRLTFLRLIFAGLLALGLSATFWLPALGEIQYVNIINDSGYGAFDFRSSFQPLSQTFALPITFAPLHINPLRDRTISWFQVIILVIGALVFLISNFPSKNLKQAVISNEAEARAITVLLASSAVLVAILIFLTTRQSTWIWETITLIQYTQLPWRMLGLASLILALMTGAGIAYLASRLRSRSLQLQFAAVCLLAIMAYAAPWQNIQFTRDAVQASTIIDTQNFERETGWIATGTLGEFIPAWVTELPDPNRLTPLYSENDIIPRLQPDPAVEVLNAEWGITSASVEFQASQNTTLILDWLFFPGWRARLNGEEIPVAPVEPTGLISVDVPEGISVIELRLGPTRVRALAMFISLLSLAAGIGLLFIPRLWQPNQTELRSV